MNYLIDEFKQWITLQGGEVRSVTNPWEVMRYKLCDGVGILYKNKKEQFTCAQRFQTDYKQFLMDTGLAQRDKVDRVQFQEKQRLKQRLLNRDGPTCCFCGQFFCEEYPATIEHFHAINETGNNHEHNCALSCEPCNGLMGSLPVFEKIKIRDLLRCEISSQLPWERFIADRSILQNRILTL